MAVYTELLMCKSTKKIFHFVQIIGFLSNISIKGIFIINIKKRKITVDKIGLLDQFLLPFCAYQ